MLLVVGGLEVWVLVEGLSDYGRGCFCRKSGSTFGGIDCLILGNGMDNLLTGFDSRFLSLGSV